MWASTPTGAGGSFRRVCRGGLYIRPVAAGSWSFLVAAWAGAYIMRPYGYDGSDPLRQGFAMPPPLGRQGETFLDSAAADDGEDFAVQVFQGNGAVGTAVGCVGAEVAQQEHASLGDAVGQGQRV